MATAQRRFPIPGTWPALPASSLRDSHTLAACTPTTTCSAGSRTSSTAARARLAPPPPELHRRWLADDGGGVRRVLGRAANGCDFHGVGNRARAHRAARPAVFRGV